MSKEVRDNEANFLLLMACTLNAVRDQMTDMSMQLKDALFEMEWPNRYEAEKYLEKFNTPGQTSR